MPSQSPIGKKTKMYKKKLKKVSKSFIEVVLETIGHRLKFHFVRDEREEGATRNISRRSEGR